jgi:predicted RND superfamily exporter protein
MFLLLITAFLFGLVSSAIQAYVATHLWAWFIVPTFNLPPLELVTAMGITLLIALLFRSRPEEEDEDAAEAFERSVKRVMISIIYSVVTLGVGFLYQSFM